eukprot:scaffold89821_cov63-Phaeocystis_antarctica.AAC.1
MRAQSCAWSELNGSSLTNRSALTVPTRYTAPSRTSRAALAKLSDSGAARPWTKKATASGIAAIHHPIAVRRKMVSRRARMANAPMTALACACCGCERSSSTPAAPATAAR